MKKRPSPSEATRRDDASTRKTMPDLSASDPSRKTTRLEPFELEAMIARSGTRRSFSEEEIDRHLRMRLEAGVDELASGPPEAPVRTGLHATFVPASEPAPEGVSPAPSLPDAPPAPAPDEPTRTRPLAVVVFVLVVAVIVVYALLAGRLFHDR